MFRKSVSFFILIALFWVVLWVYIPDGSPDKFTVSDFFRGFPLLFSLMAAAFAGLLMVIRFKGVDIVTNFIPHAGIVMWLGKHAYQYSQPNTFLNIKYSGPSEQINLEVKLIKNNFKVLVKKHQTHEFNLGHLRENPVITWQSADKIIHQQEMQVLDQLARFGKKITIDAVIQANELTFKMP